MNTEQRARLAQVMDIGARGTETVNHLARSLDQELFNENGEVVTADEYIEQLDEQRAMLRNLYENDRIFVFSSDANDLPDTGEWEPAAYYAVDANGEAFIALNVSSPELWNFGDLMHEIAHVTSDAPLAVDKNKDGHDDLIGEAYTVSELEVAKVTWEVRDTPNENSFLHSPVDDIMFHTEFTADAMRESVIARVESGEMTTDEALVYFDTITPDTVDKWLASELDGYVIPNNAELYDFLGFENDELAEGFRLGTLHDYTLTVYSERRAEMVDRLREFNEAGGEAKRETERERHYEPQEQAGGKRL